MNLESKKIAVAYCRYSSDNQNYASIDAQNRAIEQYASYNGFQIIKTYIDEAKTATTDRRPEFQQMIKDSKKRNFQYVIVHKLDRFARKRKDSIGYRAELKKNGASLISVLEPLGDDPESRLLEGFLETLAEYYSDNLGREVKKGMKETALAGKYTGGKVPYGYTINPETKKYEIVESEAMIVSEIFNMYANNRTYSNILNMLKERGAVSHTGKPFSQNVIGDMLGNEKYKGTYTFNVRTSKDDDGKRNSHSYKDNSEIIRQEGGVPQIVSSAIFEQVQLRKEKNKHGTRSRGTKEVYLLTGLVSCGCCGHAMTGNRRFSGRNKIKYVTYRCTNRNKADKCHCKEVNRDYLESFVLDVIADAILSPEKAEILFNQFQQYQKNADTEYLQKEKRLKSELRSKQMESENLIKQLEKGLATDLILQRLDSKSKEIGQIESQLIQLHDSAPKPIDKKAFNKLIKQARSVIASREHPELRSLIQYYIKEIKVNEDDISIVLTFHKIVAMVGGGEGN